MFRIFSLLSAILHLGNICYKKKTYRDDSIDICNPEVLPIVSELLEVSSWSEPSSSSLRFSLLLALLFVSGLVTFCVALYTVPIT